MCPECCFVDCVYFCFVLSVLDKYLSERHEDMDVHVVSAGSM